MRRLPAAALSLLLLTAACADDGDDEGAEATTTTAEASTTTSEAAVTTSTTTGEATTTTAAPVPATTATTEPPLGEGDAPAIPSDPAEYATALIRAWELGDAPVAEVFATDDAFNQLFAFEGAGAPGVWQLVRCEGAAGSTYCTFNAGGDPTLVVRVVNELAAQSSPDAVTEVTETG
jgi:hypothetical protein